MTIRLTIDTDDFEREMVEQLRKMRGYIEGDIQTLKSRGNLAPYQLHDLADDEALVKAFNKIINYYTGGDT